MDTIWWAGAVGDEGTKLGQDEGAEMGLGEGAGVSVGPSESTVDRPEVDSTQSNLNKLDSSASSVKQSSQQADNNGERSRSPDDCECFPIARDALLLVGPRP